MKIGQTSGRIKINSSGKNLKTGADSKINVEREKKWIIFGSGKD